jgi:hypothetical protein
MSVNSTANRLPNTQHNDIYYNNTQKNDTPHYDSHQNATGHYGGCRIFYCYVECHYDECHYLECHSPIILDIFKAISLPSI